MLVAGYLHKVPYSASTNKYLASVPALKEGENNKKGPPIMTLNVLIACPMYAARCDWPRQCSPRLRGVVNADAFHYSSMIISA